MVNSKFISFPVPRSLKKITMEPFTPCLHTEVKVVVLGGTEPEGNQKERWESVVANYAVEVSTSRLKSLV